MIFCLSVPARHRKDVPVWMCSYRCLINSLQGTRQTWQRAHVILCCFILAFLVLQTLQKHCGGLSVRTLGALTGLRGPDCVTWNLLPAHGPRSPILAQPRAGLPAMGPVVCAAWELRGIPGPGRVLPARACPTATSSCSPPHPKWSSKGTRHTPFTSTAQGIDWCEINWIECK